ncbi:hypothetical protein T08_9471 [Trichinella sp. T8]|nr:hypothetical protein T08_9471 [Trichinella sp. T8]
MAMGEEIVEMVDLRQRKQWKGSAFVATTGKLYLFIRLIFLLSWHGNVKLRRKSSDVPLCANKHKGQKSQTTLKYIWNSGMNHTAIN